MYLIAETFCYIIVIRKNCSL